MGTFNIHAGHCPQGQGASGAVGFLQESVENRIVKNRIISALRNAGHVANDCTDDTNCTANQNLQRIVEKCNARVANLDVSIHLNAGGGHGVEVWCFDGKTSNIAQSVCDQVSANLGLRNRGVKYSQSLYVLRSTNAPAILIECCFVDSAQDAGKWNANVCGDAIASALVGQKLQGNASVPVVARPTTIPKSNSNGTSTFSSWVSRLQAECNAQGYSKQSVDGIPGQSTLTGCPQIGKTSKGKITALMQERLIALGYPCGQYGADGMNGPGTQTAIKAFQIANGLMADGIVGTMTWSKLLNLR